MVLVSRQLSHRRQLNFSYKGAQVPAGLYIGRKIITKDTFRTLRHTLHQNDNLFSTNISCLRHCSPKYLNAYPATVSIQNCGYLG